MRPRLLLAALPLLAIAVPAHAESYVPPPVEEVDLLVVVDTAPGSTEERAALAGAIDEFVEALRASYPGDFGPGVSLHVGVVTGDLGVGAAVVAGCTADGDGGRLRGGPGIDGAYLRAHVDQWGAEDRNFEGELGAAVAGMIPVDVAGCAFQQPLRAVARVHDGSVADNAGFRRAGAVLAILFVTAGDDCSAADPAVFDPATAGLGPATPLRCARDGWTCAPPLDGSPGTFPNCAATATPGYLTPPSDAIGLLAALHTEVSPVVVGVLRGAPSPVEVVGEADAATVAPSCTGADGTAAAPALRLDAVATGHEGRSVLGLVCGDALPGALDALRGAIVAASSDEPPPPTWGDNLVCDAGPWGGPDAWGDDAYPVDRDDDDLFPGCAAGGGAGGALIVVVLATLVAVRRRR